MRLLLAVFAAIASLVSVPATAQSLGDLLGISRSASNSLNSFRYSGCVYEQGVFRTVCQAQRAMDTVDRANQLRRQYDDARRRSANSIQMNDPDPATITRLQTLCSNGSDEACSLIRRMRCDGTTARIENRQAAMTPQMQRAEAAYERALNAQRSGGYVQTDATQQSVPMQTTQSGSRYRTAPDYTRSGR